ncbi:MAG TPA: hypothetical protein VKU87_07885 [Thermomicrobiaceae bacterium]|nr:hypothetical protein [Thermomicrobiaceae bacterium]
MVIKDTFSGLDGQSSEYAHQTHLLLTCEAAVHQRLPRALALIGPTTSIAVQARQGCIDGQGRAGPFILSGWAERSA